MNAFQLRQQRLREALNWERYDALLVTDPLNTGYLTGFFHTANDGWVLMTPESCVLFTDPRYEGAVRDMPVQVEIWPASKKFETLRKHLPAPPATIAHERSLTTGQLETLVERLHHHRFIPLRGTSVELIRTIKDAGEIAAIREAAHFTDQAFQESLDFIRPGRTEREVRHFISTAMRRISGVDQLSFDVIVASGLNGDTPHASASGKELAAGEFVTIDMGAKNGPYCSDFTRTVLLGGGSPQRRLLDAYPLVLDAQLAGIAAVRPGATNKEVDCACRDLFKVHGLDTYFSHGTGHGVGLYIHETPRLAVYAEETEVLRNGMVLTIEPGVYLPGVGGIRIEDLVLVTETGHEILSAASKTLLTLE